jgi:hypothetical protein
MSTSKKRPSKAAKAAKKIVSESKLLNDKSEREAQDDSMFKESVPTPRTSGAIKPRPDKKRG